MAALTKALTRVLTLAAALGLTVAATAQGQVYKWVDSAGVTHYDQAPPPGSSAKKLDLPAQTSPAPAGDASSSNWSDQDRAFRERQAKRRDAEAKADAQQAKKDLACAQARDRLTSLQDTPRLYKRNPAGEREYLSDADRDQVIANAQGNVARSCSSG